MAHSSPVFGLSGAVPVTQARWDKIHSSHEVAAGESPARQCRESRHEQTESASADGTSFATGGRPLSLLISLDAIPNEAAPPSALFRGWEPMRPASRRFLFVCVTIPLQLFAIHFVVLRSHNLPPAAALQPRIGPHLAYLRLRMRFVFPDGVLAAINNGHVLAPQRKGRR